MSTAQDRGRAARFVGGLCRLVLGVFYRGIEVVGADRIPRGCPLMIVANHTNGLVDPLLILGPLRVPARFLAKSTLWRIPGLGPLIDLAGAIPVYRRQDEGADPAQNEATFARCHEVLAAGGAIALFPEGTSHSQPALKPLKTGAARIVLEAERKFGPLGVQVLPVGLFFENKGKFRSRALVQVGEAFGVEAEADLYRKDGGGQEAVRELTARIEDALEEVTLNYASWEEACRIARAADLYGRAELDVPRGRSLEETFALHRAFLAGYPRIRERFPERTAAVAAAVDDYDRLLGAAGVRDEQVAARYAPQPVLRFLGRSLGRLLVHLPLAAVGTAANIVPYLLVKLIARQVRDSPDQQATLKVFPSLVLYPLAWIAEGVAMGKWLGAGWGVLAFLLAPPAGYAAMLFHERRKLLWRESRAFLLLRTRRRLAAELRARREKVYREVDGLVRAYQEGRDQEGQERAETPVPDGENRAVETPAGERETRR